MSNDTPKRALIDTQYNQGLIKLAKGLVDNNVEIFAYDTTAAYLKKHHIPVSQTEKDDANFSSMVDLHLSDHSEYGVDLLIVTVSDIEPIVNIPTITLTEVLSQIDTKYIPIIRTAATRYDKIIPVFHPSEYDTLLHEITTGKITSPSVHIKYAQKVFGFTSKYDSIVSQYLFYNSI